MSAHRTRALDQFVAQIEKADNLMTPPQQTESAQLAAALDPRSASCLPEQP